MAALVGVPNQTYTCPSGTYTADGDGLITATGRAIVELLNAGCDLAPSGPSLEAQPDEAPRD
jgi:hypothetical protein